MSRQIARSQLDEEVLKVTTKMLRIAIWNISGKRVEPEIVFANKVVKGQTFIRIEAVIPEFEGDKNVEVTGMFAVNNKMSCEIQVGQTLRKSLEFDTQVFMAGAEPLHSARQLKHSLEYL